MPIRVAHYNELGALDAIFLGMWVGMITSFVVFGDWYALVVPLFAGHFFVVGTFISADDIDDIKRIRAFREMLDHEPV